MRPISSLSQVSMNALYSPADVVTVRVSDGGKKGESYRAEIQYQEYRHTDRSPRIAFHVLGLMYRNHSRYPAQNR